MYIKYNYLKFFLKTSTLSSLQKQYFDEKIYINPINYDIYISKKITDELIEIEEELNYCNFDEFQEKVVSIKFRHLNPDLDEKIFNLFENNYYALKINKKIFQLRKSISKQKHILENFEQIKKNLDNKKILCFDFEAFEDNQKILTELGISIYVNNEIKSKHFIVKENISYKNKKNLSDRKYNFNFGHSKIIKLNDIIKILKNDLDKVDLIIGQSIDNDFNYVRKYIQSQDEFPKNYIQMKDYKVLDTYDLTFFYKKEGMGLKKALELFEISHRNLHNGGNDSHYNLMMFLHILNDIKVEDLRNKLEDTKIKFKQEQVRFSDSFKIKNKFDIHENVYNLVQDNMLDIYFDTNNSIIVNSNISHDSKNEIVIEEKLLGGLYSSILRKVFNLNSLYIKRIYSKNKNAKVTFSNQKYKKLAIININGKYNLKNNVFTLCDNSLLLSKKKNSFIKAMFSKNINFFTQTLEGKGKAVIASNRPIKKVYLNNEEISLNDINLLAWEDTLSLENDGTKILGKGTFYMS